MRLYPLFLYLITAFSLVAIGYGIYLSGSAAVAIAVGIILFFFSFPVVSKR